MLPGQLDKSVPPTARYRFLALESREKFSGPVYRVSDKQWPVGRTVLFQRAAQPVPTWTTVCYCFSNRITARLVFTIMSRPFETRNNRALDNVTA